MGSNISFWMAVEYKRQTGRTAALIAELGHGVHLPGVEKNVSTFTP
jgi:hypothetical protein